MQGMRLRCRSITLQTAPPIKSTLMTHQLRQPERPSTQQQRRAGLLPRVYKPFPSSPPASPASDNDGPGRGRVLQLHLAARPVSTFISTEEKNQLVP